jgi:hypothetical protein
MMMLLQMLPHPQNQQPLSWVQGRKMLTLLKVLERALTVEAVPVENEVLRWDWVRAAAMACRLS